MTKAKPNLTPAQIGKLAESLTVYDAANISDATDFADIAHDVDIHHDVETEIKGKGKRISVKLYGRLFDNDGKVFARVQLHPSTEYIKKVAEVGGRINKGAWWGFDSYMLVSDVALAFGLETLAGAGWSHRLGGWVAQLRELAKVSV